MGSPVSQVAQSTQPQGKGFASPQPRSQQSDLQNAVNTATQQGVVPDYSLMQTDYSLKPGQGNMQMMAPAVMPTMQPAPGGKGGRVTYPGQSGQPQMGRPNQYSNTVGPWDNATIGNQQPRTFGSGKGKGA